MFLIMHANAKITSSTFDSIVSQGCGIDMPSSPEISAKYHQFFSRSRG